MTKLFPFSRFTVFGLSMLPTLKPGQEILTFNWAYIFSMPKVGDLVAVRVDGKDLVKRVQTIFDRNIFVIGDNKKMSTDSRKFGPIHKNEIVGKVIS